MMRILVLLSTFFSVFGVFFLESIPHNSDASGAGAVQGVQLDHVKRSLVSIKQITSKAAFDPLGVAKKNGVIVDLKRGFILTTLSPMTSGLDVSTYELTFTGGQKSSAKSVYKDPLYNIEILSFNPKKLQNLFALSFSEEMAALDMPVVLMSKNEEQEIVKQGVVASVHESRGIISAYQTLRISLNTPGGILIGGVILDDKMNIAGLVVQEDQTFAIGIVASYLSEVLRACAVSKKPSRFFFKAVALQTESLADWVKYWDFPLKNLTDHQNRFPEGLAHGIVVSEVMGKSPLRVGDVIMSVNGQRQGYSLFALHESLKKSGRPVVSVSVMRRGKLASVRVPVLNAWQSFSRELVSFGGAWFYESGFLQQALFQVPLGSVMVSKALPGSVFNLTFPRLPLSGQAGIFVSMVHSLGGQEVHSLKDLRKAIPTLFQKENFSVVFKNYGCAFGGGTLMSSRAYQYGKVDSLVSTMLPEHLIWSENEQCWITKEIAVTKQESTGKGKS